jgi:hypothetical protein
MKAVITGLVPVIHVLSYCLATKTWMAGSSPAMANGESVTRATFVRPDYTAVSL